VDAVFMTYIYLIGLESQQQARLSEKYVSVFGLSCVQNVFPNLQKEQWELTSLEFERRANFPHCLRAVDGKHIRVIKPEHSGSMFYNYKDFFSVVLMAVAVTNYRFVYVDSGSYGKDCVSTIFNRSALWTSIQTNILQLPSERPLSGTEGPNVPYFLVRDEGFALHRNILRPFGGSNLSVKKRVYKYRLCRARRYVECALEF
jgi:hypothetical protein